MRSRYSAYVLKLEDYLLQTWHPDTRPSSLDLPTEDQMKWLGLEVKRHEIQDENYALVEFIARYKMNGKAEKLQETSRFLRINDRWLYLDGVLAKD